MKRSRHTISLLAVVALAAAVPAAADWLVTRDGARLETRGAWQVKGKQVVFTQKNGQLGALQLSAVDLDASAKATASRAPLAAAPADTMAPKKRSVLVLTDKDVSHVDATGLPKGTDAASPADDTSKAAPSAAAAAVTVETWEKVEAKDLGGVEIFGSLRNTSTDTATDISLVAKLYDEGGGLLGTVDATVSASVLPPNATTNFRATFSGIVNFASARFEVKNRTLLTRVPPKPTPASTTR
ncbi:MAG: FxLYD domain-containing protein [Pseudolysinimonas sp.]